MATNNAVNIQTASSGKILRAQGVGSSPTFSTATFPDTAGSSGNVLTSDGTNWASSAPAAGGIPNPPSIYGQVIGSDTFRLTAMRTSNNSSLSTVTIAQAARIYLYPFYVGASGSFTKLAVIVTTLGALTNCRFAIYNVTDGIPSTVLVDSGNQSCTTTGIKEATGLSYSITAGFYWFGLMIDNNAVIFRSQSSTILGFSTALVGSTDMIGGGNNLYYDQTFGAFPTLTQTSLVANTSPVLPFFYIA